MSGGGVAADHSFDRDVAVVGGGPAGCSAATFTARYGLDTVVFDRGRSSLRRCAHLENYLGFPGGIDIDTFYRLIHDHAEEAGCDVLSRLVSTVDRAETGDGFVVETEDGGTVTARRVVAATRYGGEYLRLLDDGSTFERHDQHHGESAERVDRSFAESDGTTPVDGLYVASPSAESDRQAIVAAGRGARVGLAVVEAVRRDRGIPADLATHYDWLRRASELDDEWHDRETWRDHIHDRLPDDHDLDDLIEREIDRRLSAYITDDAMATRADRAHDRLLDHLDDERILERAEEIRARRPSPEAGE